MQFACRKFVSCSFSTRSNSKPGATAAQPTRCLARMFCAPQKAMRVLNSAAADIAHLRSTCTVPARVCAGWF